MKIMEVFSKYADAYDNARRTLIPCHDDFYRVALDIIPFARERELRILDLGAGTGYFAAQIARRYPHAQMLLIDISAEMLQVAAQKIDQLDHNRICFLTADYLHADFHGTYDLVVSSLSIHHLTDAEKILLYKRILSVLEPGGAFINCDQIKGDSTYADKLFHHTWLQQVRANGVDDKSLHAALERMQEDRPAPLGLQLGWLQDIGFSDVTSWYQYYGFAVFSGRKPM